MDYFSVIAFICIYSTVPLLILSVLSPLNLEKILEDEVEVSKNLLKIHDIRLQRLQELERNISTLRDLLLASPNFTNSIEYLSNPVNAYKVLTRGLLVEELLGNWTAYRTDMEEEIAENVPEPPTRETPVPSHVREMVGAIIRLQTMYRLNSMKIIKNMNCSKAADLELFGEVANELDLEMISFDWYRSAYILAEKSNFIEGNEVKILEKLAKLGYSINGLDLAGALWNQIIKIDPNNSKASRVLRQYETMGFECAENCDISVAALIKNVTQIKFFEKKSDRKFQKHVRKLCRGKVKVNTRNPICFHKIDHAYLKIAPLRVEIVLDDPRVIKFHDLVSDFEIDQIIKNSLKKLKTAMVYHVGKDGFDLSKVRTANNAWFDLRESPWLLNLEKRTALATDLNLATAEVFQVANYGFGGHYDLHFDAGRTEEAIRALGDNGNRIATLLFYLSDTDMGATIFPHLNVSVFPEKGSAILWYNLYKNGTVDERSEHMACPIASGMKWTNRWFGERGNEFLRPCLPQVNPEFAKLVPKNRNTIFRPQPRYE